MVIHRSPARRFRRTRTAGIAVLAAVATTAVPSVVSAQPTSRTQSVDDLTAQVATLTADLDALDTETSQLDEDFNQANLELAEINEAIDENQLAVDTARESLDLTTAEAKKIVVDAYVGGDQSQDPTLMGDDLDVASHRRAYLSAAHRDRTDVLDSLFASRKTLGEREDALSDLKSDADAKATEIDNARQKATARMAERQALLDNANDELRAAMDADRKAREAAEAAEAAAEQQAAAQRAAQKPASAASAAPPSSAATVPTAPAPPATPVPGPEPTATTGAARAVEVALAQQGKPYRWAASGPNSFDCSGLVMYAYAAAGRSLPHSSRSLRSMSQNLSADQLQPGDLVFGGSPVHHVGIYIGNGQMVHAPSSGDVVKISSIYNVTRKVSFGRI